MYPFINKRLYVNFGDYKLIYSFPASTIIRVEGTDEKTGQTIVEICDFYNILVETNVYLLYWFEPVSKTMVSEVHNLNSMRAYSNRVSLTGSFLHSKGKIRVLKGDAGTEFETPESETKKP